MKVVMSKIEGNKSARKFVIEQSQDNPFGHYSEFMVRYQNTHLPFADNRSRADAESECPLAARLLAHENVYALAVEGNNEGLSIRVGLKDAKLWDSFEQTVISTLSDFVDNKRSLFSHDFSLAERYEIATHSAGFSTSCPRKSGGAKAACTGCCGKHKMELKI